MTSHNSRLRQTRQDKSLKRKPFLKNHPWHPTHSYTTKLWSKSKYSAKKARSQTDSNLGPSGYEPNSASPNLHTMKVRLTYDWNTGGSAPGLHRVAVQSDIGVFFAYFRFFFHFPAKNSLTLAPSGTECFAHVFSLLDVPLSKTVWPSGLRRWLMAPFRKGVGSNLTAVTFPRVFGRRHWKKKTFLFRAQKAVCRAHRSWSFCLQQSGAKFFFCFLFAFWNKVVQVWTHWDFNPGPFRMRSGCDATTPCALIDTVYLHMNLDHYMTMNFRPPGLNYSRLKEVKNLVRELLVLPASSLADAGVRDEREMGSRTVRRLEPAIYGLEVQRLVRGLELLVFPTRSNKWCTTCGQNTEGSVTERVFS